MRCWISHIIAMYAQNTSFRKILVLSEVAEMWWLEKMIKMNVLSCQESEGSYCRDRGMSVKSEVGCLSVLKEMSKDFGWHFSVKWHYVTRWLNFLSVTFPCCSWHVELMILLACNIYLLLHWFWSLRGVMSHFCYFCWAIIIRETRAITVVLYVT
jgi:hypothetical protein